MEYFLKRVAAPALARDGITEDEMTDTNLTQLLCAAEIAKAALSRASIDRTDGWATRYALAEDAWAIAEDQLRGALSDRGLDVQRVVEVLS
jgi:hypothetical protein